MAKGMLETLLNPEKTEHAQELEETAPFDMTQSLIYEPVKGGSLSGGRILIKQPKPNGDPSYAIIKK